MTVLASPRLALCRSYPADAAGTGRASASKEGLPGMDTFPERRPVSRRDFLARTVSVGAAVSLPGPSCLAAGQSPSRSKIIAFSKPFQTATASETADIVAEIGWDGIECPVRSKGQIEPERVAEDLPRMVEALRKVGREVSLISTDIKAVDPLAEKVLRTASRLGIRRYRLAFWKYSADKPIADQIAEVRAATRDVAALNKELDICGSHQNHSGADRFGASVWDIYEVVKDCDPRYLGVCFDIGHARIEGGLSWPIRARLVRPFLTAVFVKDFTWQRGAKGWKPEWCPLGSGMLPPEFFRTLRDSAYSGPISQHFEYQVGRGAAMIQAMKKDLARLKQWLIH
jgi:sugar phosphate isomerase/epimerase